MFDSSSYIDEFLAEVKENTARIREGLCSFPARPAEARPELIADLFRWMHSIKGAAGMLGFRKIHLVSEASEVVLGRVRAGELELSELVRSRLLAALDKLDALLASKDAEDSVDIEPERHDLAQFFGGPADARC
jgi:two-component system chemotaxis sensor kinase CheA